MGLKIKRTLLTIFLVILSGWLLVFSWQARQVAMNSFDYSMNAADRLKAFPEVQYQIGYQFWLQDRSEEALNLFQRAVSENILHLDAWLKIGEIEAAHGNSGKATEILEFTNQISPNVYRWKWQQMMLAYELGATRIFIDHVNGLIPYVKNRNNTLFFLDQAYHEDTIKILNILKPENYLFYLNWLMGARRVDDAQDTWRMMDDTERMQPEILSRYVHFLLHNKRVADAKTAWNRAGHSGITNPKFEKKISNRGFGWQLYNPKTKLWMIKRKYLLQSKRENVVQVTFTGRQNLSFSSFLQILSVNSGKKYRVTWEWKSRLLTTDQRPFFEIYGFDFKGVYFRGAMLPRSTDWHEGFIEFEVPAGCEAVVIRLRRLPSQRFDSKINGRLWLDNFNIQILG